MSERIYFFDTYALMEILQKNPNYEKYSELEPIINNFVFAEFCYNLFKDKEKNAKEYIDEIKPAIKNINPGWIEEGMSFRIKWKDRKVSMADCIGYVMAKHLEIKFLTGDKEFKGMENVEFVK